MKGRQVQVCAKCTQKRLLLHGKKKNSLPLVSSFFKVMVGADFSRVLYLPPKFRSTVSALVDRKVILEDSSEQQWKVTVSIVNESFAFHQGWDVFSLEHGLKVGDFLVFYYMKGSHFVVNIYDRSGCEKLDFARNRNPKQRGRKRGGSAARGGSYGINAENMSIRGGSRPSIFADSDVPKTHKVIDVEGPLVVSDSDVEETRILYKGADAEGPQNNVKNTSKDDNSNGRVQSVFKLEHLEDPCCMTDRDFGGIEREDRNPMFDLLACEIWNNSGVDSTGKTTTRDAQVPHSDNKSHASQSYNRRNADASSYKSELQAKCVVGLSKVIKGESGQSSHTATEDHDSILKVGEAEPIGYLYQFQTTATASCVVPPDNELLLSCIRVRVEMQMTVGLLRDPQRELRPVLHEQSNFQMLY